MISGIKEIFSSSIKEFLIHKSPMTSRSFSIILTFKNFLQTFFVSQANQYLLKSFEYDLNKYRELHGLNFFLNIIKINLSKNKYFLYNKIKLNALNLRWQIHYLINKTIISQKIYLFQYQNKNIDFYNLF